MNINAHSAKVLLSRAVGKRRNKAHEVPIGKLAKKSLICMSGMGVGNIHRNITKRLIR